MAVGHMVYDLSDGPSPRAVRSIQLLLRESGHRSSKVGRGLRDIGQARLLLIFGKWSGKMKLADEILQIGHSVLHVELSSRLSVREGRFKKAASGSGCVDHVRRNTQRLTLSVPICTI